MLKRSLQFITKSGIWNFIKKKPKLKSEKINIPESNLTSNTISIYKRKLYLILIQERKIFPDAPKSFRATWQPSQTHFNPSKGYQSRFWASQIRYPFGFERFLKNSGQKPDKRPVKFTVSCRNGSKVTNDTRKQLFTV